MTKIESQLKDLKRAINRLDESLSLEKSDIARDSSIKRFEMVMDLVWKVLKTKLENEEQIIVRSPVDAFRESYKQGYLENEGEWVEFIKMRNETVHIYKEILADRVYKKLPKVLLKLQKLYQRISS